VPIHNVEPETYYVLSLSVFRDSFRNGWYPEIEIFGRRIYLNQHTTHGGWQSLELLLKAPSGEGGETWFRFLNRYPCRFWLARPRLRPFRLSGLRTEYTDAGAVLSWEETASRLVLRMGLVVTDPGGGTARYEFLNVEGQRAHRQVLPEKDPGKGTGAGRIPGMTWVALSDEGRFRFELAAHYQDEVIAETSLNGQEYRHGNGEKDLTGICSPLETMKGLPRDFFPIGIFNVPVKESTHVRDAGFNTVLPVLQQGGQAPEDLLVRRNPGRRTEDEESQSVRWVYSSLQGRNPIREEGWRQDQLRSTVMNSPRKSVLCMYIADEPELSGTPPAFLYSYRKYIQQEFSSLPTAAAMVRTRFLPYYTFCSDWLLVDPYPVPNRPLTWLSDSLDQAKKQVGANRVMAVIQAFGGEANASRGWSRFPTLEEMRTLAFLAVVHGARGILFYDYPSASKTEAHWEVVTRVVRDLNGVYPWLVRPTAQQDPDAWCLTAEGWKRDRDPVHATVFQAAEAETHWMLIAVNPTNNTVEARFEGLRGRDQVLREALAGRPVVLRKGVIMDRFSPQSVHVYMSTGD
jgi:hypothetical protein